MRPRPRLGGWARRVSTGTVDGEALRASPGEGVRMELGAPSPRTEGGSPSRARRDCAPGQGRTSTGARWHTGGLVHRPAPAARGSARFEHFAERGRVLGQLGQCIGKIGEHYVDDKAARILGVLNTELQRPDNLIKVVS